MAKLYYKYGTVNSGKSLELLKVAHNYEEQDKKVIVFTSGIDDRYGAGKVTSRAGIEREALTINSTDNIVDLIVNYHDSSVYGNMFTSRVYSCILVDEAQFLTREQIKQLAYIVDEIDIPVIAYGLKTDFSNKLFESSKELLIQADKIEEIKTICSLRICDNKAIMSVRIDEENNALYEGEQIEIGGNERYVPVCRKHYYNY